jgi:F-type H+-transporting ATPase subunit epsilon
MIVEKLNLQIITPERVMVHEDVDMVEALGAYGEFGILPGYTQFLTTIGVGEIRYYRGEEKSFIATGGGYMEVAENQILFLVSTGEFAGEIDVERARVEAAEAEAALKALSMGTMEYRLQELALLKAIAKISVAAKARL